MSSKRGQIEFFLPQNFRQGAKLLIEYDEDANQLKITDGSGCFTLTCSPFVVEEKEDD